MITVNLLWLPHEPDWLSKNKVFSLNFITVFFWQQYIRKNIILLEGVKYFDH